MKVLLLTLLFTISLPLLAQSADGLYGQACGPLGERVAPEPAQGPAVTAPEPGKALVYVIQRDDHLRPSTRVGLDGRWVGVLERDAFIPLSVTPGEHHLCVATQNEKRREPELSHVNAEPGKVYYFVVRYETVALGEGGFLTMTLEPVDRDEALYLMASDSEGSAKRHR